MKILKRSLQGTAKQDLGRMLALEFFQRHRQDQLILIGPVSIEIRHGFGLRKTEALLEAMVEDGLLRPATPEELERAGRLHGYYLTEAGRDWRPDEE